ncbi:MAG: hypothetical protein MJY84_05240 [Bacteroidales bacterium]|nr:hypothetical protein [Bacteroidales bacterium]
MKSNGNYDWKFSTLGGVTRVSITTGQDIAHLDELDQKLWTVLSCPVSGLEMEDRTLAMIDADADGKIHVNDVLATAKWLTGILKDPELLVKDGDEVSLSQINVDVEEGKAIYDSAKSALEYSGKEKDSISLEEASAYHDLVFAKPFNGDGIIVPASAEDEALKQTLTDAIACEGGSQDRCGEAGIDADGIERFYTAVSDCLAWQEAGQADKENVFPYGDGTAAAFGAVSAVKAKLDDYFLRCKLAAFNPTDASLDVSADKISAVSAKNLADNVAEIAEYPIAKVAPGQALSLVSGINPAWQAAVASLKSLVLDVEYPDAAELTEEQWNAVQAKFAAFNDWNAAKKGATVEGLGIDRLKEIQAADQKGALLKLVEEDKALDPTVVSIESVIKLLTLNRDFFTFIRNFVTFQDFYASFDGSVKAVFQAGTLYIDQRSTDLCVKVADMGKHADMASQSGMFILYCSCTSKQKAGAMDIAAVITEGKIDSFKVGQNAIFYDRDGLDWDAVVTKIVDNPISVKQAFFSPYRKFANTLSERLKKNVADKESKVSGDMSGKAGEINLAAPADPAAAPKQPFDIAKFAGIFAALGMAVGLLLSALTKLITPWTNVLIVLLVIVVLISGPSMIMAWIKLRKRNIAPVLNANGWAVNARALVNTKFGSFFTKIAKLPKVKGKDPFSVKTPCWKKALIWLVVLAVVFCFVWYKIPVDKRPFLKNFPAAKVKVEAPAAESEAAAEATLVAEPEAVEADAAQ